MMRGRISDWRGASKHANDNRKRMPGGWWPVPVFWMAFLLLLGWMGYQALAGEMIVGRASVIDGDTIEIRGERIRLWGIDAPEGKQRCFRNGEPWRCGTKAANALDRYLAARTVRCTEKDRDRYGRIVAVCTAGGEDIGAWLVRHGWALDYTRYSDGAYSGPQRQAMAASNGIWQGEFERPWEWRRR